MKNRSFTLLSILLVVGPPAQSAVIVYEGFGVPAPYPDSTPIAGGSGGQNWFDNWSDSGSDFRVQTTGLTYNDLQTTPGALLKDAGAGFGTAERHFSSSDISSDTLYFSFLLQRGSGNSSSDNFFILDSFTSGQERFRISNNGSGQLIVEAKTVGGSGSHVSGGTTTDLDIFTNPVLVVGILTLGMLNDTFTVYFNPSDLSNVAGTAAQTITLAESTVLGGGTFSGVSTWRIDSTGRANRFDELRLAYGSGATLADVLPVPEPAALALGFGLFTLLYSLVFRRSRQLRP